MKKNRREESVLRESTTFEKLRHKVSLLWYELRYRVYALFHKSAKSKPKKPGSMKKARAKELIFYACFAAIPVAQWTIFWLFANINNMFLAFKQYNTLTNDYTWVGLFWFRRAWLEFTQAGGALREAMKVSIANYAFGFVTLPLSVLLPYYVYKKMPASDFFKVMLFLPGVFSEVVMSVLYQYVIDRAIPEFFLNHFGITFPSLLADMRYRFWGIQLYGWVNLGGTVLIYTAQMSRIPSSIVESAQLDGCSPMREFWSITMPLIWPTFTIYQILGFSGIFTNQMGLYTFFGSSSSLKSVGYYIFTNTVGSDGYSNYPYVASMGLSFTLIVAPLTILLRHVLNKIIPTVEY